MTKLFASILFALSLVTVAACGGGGGDGDDDGPGPSGDADGDGIRDGAEGSTSNTDTDRDGTPDYQDTDSDDDGIPDSTEAGDEDLNTDPYDSDGDGTPDFRDLDSDDNGRADGVDGTEDGDGDFRPDFADNDDDGDNIADPVELGADPANPVDFDSDGTPDFRDTDSDNDTVRDQYETSLDFDSDGVGNYHDLDSDGDCRSDQVESGGVMPPRNSDDDSRADFVDRDSDNDGVADGTEDADCDGTRDAAETDPLDGDSDDDGASDLVEEAAGTDPLDPGDNPQANGDFVFVMPYNEPPSPMDDDLDFRTNLQSLDMYVVLDRSGSMSSEISTVKNNLSTVVRNLTCPPLGNGTPGMCIPDLWAGAGTVGYSGSGADTFVNHVDVQPNPSFASVAINEPGGCCAEPLTFSVYSTITGNGSGAATGCGLSGVSPRLTCTGSPARNAGYDTFGYPCFREGVLPVILLTTDEVPLSSGDTNKCPDWQMVVRPIMNARGAKLMGIMGSGGVGTAVQTDLQQMAMNTGAVDAANGNMPLVFDGSNTAAATAIENGVRTLARGVPLDLNAIPQDDPADTVDAVREFVHHLETLQLGTAQCANMLSAQDTNGDLFPDQYLDVRAGTPVCWKLVPKMNTTVVTTEQPQLFRATVTVIGDGITELDQRTVFFLVPPVVDIPE
ncbi:MAG TPA: hypothetical protein VM261_21120 [Kofleriaceae bacterium]|nr:hypothetical protein [Kofleriaceae bacterium]